MDDLTTKETNTPSYLARVLVMKRKKCFETLIYIAKALSNKPFVTVTALSLTSQGNKINKQFFLFCKDITV
jgi:hypothetical protein